MIPALPVSSVDVAGIIMEKAPVKSVGSIAAFPSALSDNISSLKRTAFTHVSTLHGLIIDWIRVQDKGAKICKTISALKLEECEDDYYPQQLVSLTVSLLEALSGLKHIVEGVAVINSQLQALAKLHPTDQPVISTWSVQQMSNSISKITHSLQKEYQVKKVITENIAHCRDANLIEVYVSSWEFDVYFSSDDAGYLFVEVGIPAVDVL